MVKLIDESNLLEKISVHKKEETRQRIVEWLKVIINNRAENLINIFKLDSEEGFQNIELAILRAFLNSMNWNHFLNWADSLFYLLLKFKGRQKQHFENFKLALQWNRVDIAKLDILTGEEEFTDEERDQLFEMALVQDKVEFIELLLETGINLNAFLTEERLYSLYNYRVVKYNTYTFS